MCHMVPAICETLARRSRRRRPGGFQLWLLPPLLVGSLGMALVFGWSRSIWPSLVGHFVVNFALGMVGFTALVLGAESAEAGTR